MKMSEVTLSGRVYRNVRVEIGRYHDMTDSVALMTESGESLTTATVNLHDYGKIPPPGTVFIRNYSGHEGLAKQLEAAGIGRRTRENIRFGPYDANAEEFVLAPEVLEYASRKTRVEGEGYSAGELYASAMGEHRYGSRFFPDSEEAVRVPSKPECPHEGEEAAWWRDGYYAALSDAGVSEEVFDHEDWSTD